MLPGGASGAPSETFEVHADAESTSLVIANRSLLQLASIGLGVQLPAVLGVRNDLLILTSPEAQAGLLASHIGATARAVMHSVPGSLGVYLIVFPLVLLPPDWGTYRVEFAFGQFVALGELPAAHRNYTLH